MSDGLDNTDDDRKGGPRYAPGVRLVALARMAAGSRAGITIEHVMEELCVRRRTAERLIVALGEAFAELERIPGRDGEPTRWRLPGPAAAPLAVVGPEVIAAIEASAREHHARGEVERGQLLRHGALSLRVMMRPEVLRRAEPDIEGLMQGEGIAMRPGPRAVIPTGMLQTLRRGILGMQLVAIRYSSGSARRGDGAAATAGSDAASATRIIHPYGILYGGRGWLVAHVEGTPAMRLWRLDRILSADLLDRTFIRQEEFSLADYAARSFGVFQEEPVKVRLRFIPSAASEAGSWMFHPTQVLEPQEDGALVVSFEAGGAREICWHLFQWGGEVEILAPETLRETMREMLTASLDAHGAAGSPVRASAGGAGKLIKHPA